MALYDVSLTGGEDGKSAYQYAVEAGYEGTEEEFAQLLNDIDDIKNTGGVSFDTATDEEIDGILDSLN